MEDGRRMEHEWAWCLRISMSGTDSQVSTSVLCLPATHSEPQSLQWCPTAVPKVQLWLRTSQTDHQWHTAGSHGTHLEISESHLLESLRWNTNNKMSRNVKENKTEDYIWGHPVKEEKETEYCNYDGITMYLYIRWWPSGNIANIEFSSF